MTVVKDHRFYTAVRWLGRGRTLAAVPGKTALRVSLPVDLKGTDPDAWSPEDLLVTAVASCYAVTLAAVAEHRGLTLQALEVEGVGHVETGRDGRLAFVAIELHATIEADVASLAAVEEAARAAEKLCLVHRALDTPVHVELELRAADANRDAA